MINITPQPKTAYDWSECIEYLEKKYEFKHRDYLNKYGNSHEILLKEILEELGESYSDLEEDLSKADKTDPEVQRKLEVREKVYIEQELRKPIYRDFWHHICEKQDVHNGSYIYFSTEDLDEDYSEEDKIFKQYGPLRGHMKDESHDGEWIKTIIRYILTEFADENGECEFCVSW